VSGIPTIRMNPGRLTVRDFRAPLEGPLNVQLEESVWGMLEAHAAAPHARAHTNDAIYGLNTGFGKLARTRIAPDKLAALQPNLVLSHSAAASRTSRCPRSIHP
jgi:histidine ammonia-lyase